jgi:hypothetical protein
VRCNQVVYFAPLRQSARRRRPKLLGAALLERRNS